MLEGLKILAMHHDPGLNGAAVLFQSILEGLVRNYGAQVSSIFPADGPVAERMAALGPVRVLGLREPRPGDTPFRRASDRFRQRFAQRNFEDHHLIFANSAASLRRVRQLRLYGRVPLAVYIHESEYLLRNLCDFQAVQEVLADAAQIFVVSHAVQHILEEAVPAARGKFTVIPGFTTPRTKEASAASYPAELETALQSGTRLIGALGTLSWYKGADLVPVVARRVKELLPGTPVKFLWVGAEWQRGERLQMRHDLKRAGLLDDVLLPGEVRDPTRFLEKLDLFLLPSREDSWPLAMLEAASVGTPILCFQESGGAPEFAAAGGGTAVPYLDVEAMAREIVRHLSDPAHAAAQRERAREAGLQARNQNQIRRFAETLAAMMGRQGKG